MEALNILSKIKFTSYQIIFLFLFSLIVPGISFLFLFHRDLFNNYDLTRLIFLTISISFIQLFFSITIISSLFFQIAFKFRTQISKIDFDDSDQEGILRSSILFGLTVFFLVEVIFFLIGCNNIRVFIIVCIIGELIYYFISKYALIKLLKATIEERKFADEKKQKEILLKRLQKNLFDAQRELVNAKQWKWGRSYDSRIQQIQLFENRIHYLSNEINKQKGLQ